MAEPTRIAYLLAMLTATLTLNAAATLPAAAKDSLGVFSNWAAFRDDAPMKCYAIARADPARQAGSIPAYATIGSWPDHKIRNQVHFRLSRQIANNAQVTLRIGGRNFALMGRGADAWARDPAMDAAIVAAIRSADQMVVRSISDNGRRFSDRYTLGGAATAIDAATLACSGRAS